jgi:hypothetical protein
MGRIAQIGLAIGSTRSRRQECGPRVEPLHVRVDYLAEGKGFNATVATDEAGAVGPIREIA